MFAQPLFHRFFALGCAVVPAAKQAVPRHIEVAVVAFKKAVVDLVVEHAQI